jgi:hypothetical protein
VRRLHALHDRRRDPSKSGRVKARKAIELHSGKSRESIELRLGEPGELTEVCFIEPRAPAEVFPGERGGVAEIRSVESRGAAEMCSCKLRRLWAATLQAEVMEMRFSEIQFDATPVDFCCLGPQVPAAFGVNT